MISLGYVFSQRNRFLLGMFSPGYDHLFFICLRKMSSKASFTVYFLKHNSMKIYFKKMGIWRSYVQLKQRTCKCKRQAPWLISLFDFCLHAIKDRIKLYAIPKYAIALTINILLFVFCRKIDRQPGCYQSVSHSIFVFLFMSNSIYNESITSLTIYT